MKPLILPLLLCTTIVAQDAVYPSEIFPNSIFWDVSEVISGGLVDTTLLGRLNSTESGSLTAGIESGTGSWMIAKHGQTYAANLRDALTRLDPEHAEEYRFNAGLYIQQLQDLEREIFQKILRIPANRRILASDHQALQDYGEHYGIRIEKPKDETTVDKDLYLDSLANPQRDSLAATYTGTLRYNAEVIVAAMSNNAEKAADQPQPVSDNWGIWLAAILGVVVSGFVLLAIRTVKK